MSPCVALLSFLCSGCLHRLFQPRYDVNMCQLTPCSYDMKPLRQQSSPHMHPDTNTFSRWTALPDTISPNLCKIYCLSVAWSQLFPPSNFGTTFRPVLKWRKKEKRIYTLSFNPGLELCGLSIPKIFMCCVFYFLLFILQYFIERNLKLVDYNNFDLNLLKNRIWYMLVRVGVCMWKCLLVNSSKIV